MNANACDLGVSIRFRVSVWYAERQRGGGRVRERCNQQEQQQRKGEIPNSTAACKMLEKCKLKANRNSKLKTHNTLPASRLTIVHRSIDMGEPMASIFN